MFAVLYKFFVGNITKSENGILPNSPTIIHKNRGNRDELRNQGTEPNDMQSMRRKKYEKCKFCKVYLLINRVAAQ
jgi:hypothetical protein